MLPKVHNVSRFGKQIHVYCQYMDTYRLVRDEQPVGKNAL